MKGIHGLIIAVALGLLGAAANFLYLNAEARKTDMVGFIGIKKGLILGRGDRLTDDNLVEVEIPKNHVGNLGDYVFTWKERVGVKGLPVWRTLDSKTDPESESVVLLRSDVVEPPPKDLQLGKGELGEFIPVPKNSDMSHVNPGDKVSFRVRTFAAPSPTPAFKPPTAASTPAAVAPAFGVADVPPKPEDAETPPPSVGSSDIIGPFVVVSIGNRLSTVEAQKGAKIAPVQQNVLLIRVSKNVPGEEEKYERLATCIQRFGQNCYTISLHGKE